MKRSLCHKDAIVAATGLAVCVCVFKCHYFDPHIAGFTCVFLTFVQVTMDNGSCACLFVARTKGAKRRPFVQDVYE